MPKKSNTDRLVRSTARIEAHSNGAAIGYGLGALMTLKCWGEDDPRQVFGIVTNKHVVEGTDAVLYSVPLSGNVPVATTQVPASAIVPHPDPRIDLCFLPVAPAIYHRTIAHDAEFIASKDIFDDEKLEQLNAIENVVMIGYPNALIDKKAMFPISWKGITATPAYARYNDEPDFMIDCACFPGSSGSPVFILDHGLYIDKENNPVIGRVRFGLLGFLYSGPTISAQGQLVPAPPPTSLAQMVDVPLMMNLGICVRASQLSGLYEAIKAVAVPEPQLGT